MYRRCFLVSRPIEAQNFLASASSSANATQWRTIGNGIAVPKVTQKLSFIEHWALCVLPCASAARPSAPSSRDGFLNADYFDLNVSTSRSSPFHIISQSNSYTSLDNSSTKWVPGEVMDISAAIYIGQTEKSNDWILDKARDLTVNWGQYRPILWNCQHFSVLIAQIAVGTTGSASIINKLLSDRNDFVSRVRSRRQFGYMAGFSASAFVPSIGPVLSLGFWATSGIYAVADDIKDTEIAVKLGEFREKYEELRQI